MTALLKCDACGNLIDPEIGYVTFHHGIGMVEHRHFSCSPLIENQGGDAVKNAMRKVYEDNTAEKWQDAITAYFADTAGKEGTE